MALEGLQALGFSLSDIRRALVVDLNHVNVGKLAEERAVSAVILYAAIKGNAGPNPKKILAESIGLQMEEMFPEEVS